MTVYNTGKLLLLGAVKKHTKHQLRFQVNKYNAGAGFFSVLVQCCHFDLRSSQQESLC